LGSVSPLTKMNRNHLILAFIVGMLWFICELCPTWFYEKLPPKCQLFICHRSQIEKADQFNFIPLVTHNYVIVIEWASPFGEQKISFDLQRPTTKRIGFASLLVGIVLLGLRLKSPRWLMLVVRISGVLALLIAVLVIVLISWVVIQ
jgi:hypothetical protein